MDEEKHEEIKISKEVTHYNFDERLNILTQRLEQTMGNVKDIGKLTVFYFQVESKFKDMTPEDIFAAGGHLFLIIGLINPLNPNTLIGAVPIAFKDEVFSLQQEDINIICNNAEDLFGKKVKEVIETNEVGN